MHYSHRVSPEKHDLLSRLKLRLNNRQTLKVIA